MGMLLHRHSAEAIETNKVVEKPKAEVKEKTEKKSSKNK